MEQKLINQYKDIDEWIEENQIKSIFLVCKDSIKLMKNFCAYLDILKIHVKINIFSDFQSNPSYNSVIEGVKSFRKSEADAIMAVGGGSAIDVAKCIKLYAYLPGDGENGCWIGEEGRNRIPFLVTPTTAGTGSEATRYAVVYYEGEKQSITSDSLIPQIVFMYPDALNTLPLYQRKSTMCDALCHAIESFWSLNSTDKSKEYSRMAIRGVMTYMNGYLENTEEGNAGMLWASHIAGKAINITQTTAGHAMCYKITSLYNVAHGHAAMLCDRILYQWMIDNTDRCKDYRGENYLKQILDEIGQAMGAANRMEGAKKLISIFNKLQLSIPKASVADYEILKKSVNYARLKNNPIKLDEKNIDEIYHKILI